MTPTPLDLDLDELDSSSAGLPASPARARALAEIRAAVRAPASIVLIGRAGVGKTTIANRESGEARPVGLNGVTRAVTRAGRWIDTPGIDDPLAAIDTLSPLVEAADGIVWVVDGLQPLPATEREVAAAVLPRGAPLVVAVTRRDLIDPGDVEEVLARVAAKTSPFRPDRIVIVDARREAVKPPDLQRSPRWNRVRHALEALRTEPPRPVLQEVVGRWRAEVRSAVAAAEADLDPVHPGRSLAREAPVVIARMRDFTEDETLALPTPGPPARLGPLGGVGAAVRALRDAAARWLAAGEIVLREDWPGAAARERERLAHERFRTAVDRALERLPATEEGSTPPERRI